MIATKKVNSCTRPALFFTGGLKGSFKRPLRRVGKLEPVVSGESHSSAGFGGSTTAACNGYGRISESPEEDMMDVDTSIHAPCVPEPQPEAAPAPVLPSFPILPRVIGIEDFEIGKLLGSGGFGKVVLAKHKATETFHAIKMIKKTGNVKDDEQVFEEQRALCAFIEFNDASLPKLRATFHDTKYFYFVLEYLHGGDLSEEMRVWRGFSKRRVRVYMAQLVHALTICQKLKILHRDIKLDNILVDAQGGVVLNDCGLAKVFGVFERIIPGGTPAENMFKEKDYILCGTAGYTAPEMISGLFYSYAADIFSLGVVMYEMITGKAPFYGRNTEEIWHATVNFLPPKPEMDVEEEALDLMLRMLDKNHHTRIDIESIKKHPYFDTIDWDDIASRKTCYHTVRPAVENMNVFFNFENPPALNIGTAFEGVPDPYPNFTFISPRWMSLAKGGLKSRNALLVAFHKVKTVLKAPKSAKFKFNVLNNRNFKSRGKFNARAPIFRRRKQQPLKDIANVAPAPAALNSSLPVPRMGRHAACALHSPARFLQMANERVEPTPVQIAVEPVQRPIGLPRIVIPAPTADNSAWSGSCSPSSSSPSPDLWVVTPISTPTRPAFLDTLKRSVKRIIPSIRLTPRWREHKFELLPPTSNTRFRNPSQPQPTTAADSLSLFNNSDIIPVPIYSTAARMDVDQAAST